MDGGVWDWCKTCALKSLRMFSKVAPPDSRLQTPDSRLQTPDSPCALGLLGRHALALHALDLFGIFGSRGLDTRHLLPPQPSPLHTQEGS